MAPNKTISMAFAIAGSVTTSLMYASPVKAVWQAREKGTLGAIDARPFAVSVLCAASWIAYGFVSGDYFMFQPNIAGITASIFCAVASYGLADKKAQNFMLAVFCLTTLSLPILGIMAMGERIMSHAKACLMWGLTADIITILYYGSPLSTAVKIIKTKNSDSILLPRLVCDIGNSGLWTVYGIMAGDPFIIVPNGIGVTLGFCLAIIKAIYWRRPTPAFLEAAITGAGPSDGGAEVYKDAEAVICTIVPIGAGKAKEGVEQGTDAC